MMDRRVFLAILPIFPAVLRAEPACCGQITSDGDRLRHFLDESGVDHLWLPGFRIHWKTGTPIEAWPAGTGAHTHCSAFAGSAAMRLGIYLLRPPEHRQTLLANAQMGWLRDPEAAASGWRSQADVVAAQSQANRGALVVAAFENPNPTRPGHIAIIRPGPITTSDLMQIGPMVTQAGGHNALSVSLARGFGNHRGAWIPGGGGSVRYFAHDVNWSQAG